jgi:transcriptional regulator with XRE-family HTH domain
VGLTRQTISKLERGFSNEGLKSPANPTMALLLAFSRELDVQLRLDQSRGGEVRVEFDEPD